MKGHPRRGPTFNYALYSHPETKFSLMIAVNSAFPDGLSNAYT